MKSIAFFNHKGGVGKTTLVFNIGLALARMNSTVLFVDADAQANLTSVALDIDTYEKALDRVETIYGGLLPVIESSGDISPKCTINIRDRVHLLPGDIRLSEFEEILPTAWTEAIAGQRRGFQVSSAMFRLVLNLADIVEADYIIYDLGPNVGALNRTIITSVDGFVVPLAPDLFSLTALPSVGRSVSRWVQDWRAAKGQAERAGISLNIPLPKAIPVPIGYVNQQFVTYRDAPATAFKKWMERIPSSYEDGIVSPLRNIEIPIPDSPHALGEVKNLSSLIPMAQQENKAVFELTGSQARGAQYTRAKDTYELFSKLAETIVGKVDALTD